MDGLAKETIKSLIRDSLRLALR